MKNLIDLGMWICGWGARYESPPWTAGLVELSAIIAQVVSYSARTSVGRKEKSQWSFLLSFIHCFGNVIERNPWFKKNHFAFQNCRINRFFIWFEFYIGYFYCFDRYEYFVIRYILAEFIFGIFAFPWKLSREHLCWVCIHQVAASSSINLLKATTR